MSVADKRGSDAVSVIVPGTEVRVVPSAGVEEATVGVVLSIRIPVRMLSLRFP
jgi:hypothetical protein